MVITETRSEADILDAVYTWLTWIHILNAQGFVQLDEKRLADLRRDLKHVDELLQQKKREKL